MKLKKRITRIVSIFMMIFMISVVSIGCSNGNKSEESKDETNTIVKDSEEKDNASEDDKSKDASNKELTGFELLKSLDFNPPKNYMFQSELKMSESMSSKSTTYIKGNSMRVESEGDILPGKTIMIYNAKEGITYQYTEGTNIGVMMADGEDDEDAMMDMDTSVPNLKDLFEELGEDVVARMETLDGEEVIYIEAVELDEEMGNVDVYMWYSTKYFTPLKYEMKTNEKLVLQSKVTKIEANIDIDDAMFEKPANVQFQDFNLDDIFGAGSELDMNSDD